MINDQQLPLEQEEINWDDYLDDENEEEGTKNQQKER